MRPIAGCASRSEYQITRMPFFCPYCGSSFSKNALLTRDQLEHVQRTATEEARVYAIDEIQKMFKSAFRGSKNITYKPGTRPIKRPVMPTYTEREVDTELECAECSTQFQVYGIFGYCPGCKCENLQIYDANWTIIRRGIDSAADKKRQLRHAYSDLVSTFEGFLLATEQRSSHRKQATFRYSLTLEGSSRNTRT